MEVGIKCRSCGENSSVIKYLEDTDDKSDPIPVSYCPFCGDSVRKEDIYVIQVHKLPQVRS